MQIGAAGGRVTRDQPFGDGAASKLVDGLNLMHDPMLGSVGMPPMTVYCLTRDRDLAVALDDRLLGAIVFFFNDAARLHQAVTLRAPDLVVVDTGAIREEYGDAGLGPVVDFLRHRSPDAGISVRPTAGTEYLVAAEAGQGVKLVPAELSGCVAAVATLCGCA